MFKKKSKWYQDKKHERYIRTIVCSEEELIEVVDSIRELPFDVKDPAKSLSVSAEYPGFIYYYRNPDREFKLKYSFYDVYDGPVVSHSVFAEEIMKDFSIIKYAVNKIKAAGLELITFQFGADIKHAVLYKGDYILFSGYDSLYSWVKKERL